MDDRLERIRAQFEAERRQAEFDRANRLEQDLLAIPNGLKPRRCISLLEGSVAVIAELLKGKPAMRRNLQFAVWIDDQKLKPAAIRDRWNESRIVPLWWDAGTAVYVDSGRWG